MRADRALLRGTELPREDVELVILRTVWNSVSGYEWAQHVALAEAAGLDTTTRARVREGAAAHGWSLRQRASCSSGPTNCTTAA